AVPAVGVERAFRRELGAELEELGVEWRESMQTRHLAPVPRLERPRHFAEHLLSESRTRGGEVFLAPALSSDGRHVAFFANGSYARGEVFIDLWLGDARTGRRIERLAKSTTGPFEELRFLYSQAAFSPDGSMLAFTAQRRGRDVLVLMDVARRREIRRLDLPVETAMSPSFSPDGSQIVFSGTRGGISDLFIVDVTGVNLRQLTSDHFGDLHPAWSPDGRRIAFATDRGNAADLAVLALPPMRIATYDLERGVIEILPGQAGLSINPQWSPDGETLAFVSDRSGIPNVFLYDFSERAHYQLTNLLGGVAGITEMSPAISWAQRADHLAVSHFDDGRYTVWSFANPRARKRLPYAGESISIGAVARRPGFTSAPDPADATYRPPVSVAQLLDSATVGLPDASEIADADYRARLHPDYVARPSIGYAPDSYGRNVFGGTTVVLSDMLGDERVGFAAEINGRLEEARLFAAYSLHARRWQYSAGVSQSPFYFLSSDQITEGSDGRRFEDQVITTYLVRQGFAAAAYPFSRFNRLELGAGYNTIGVRRSLVQRDVTAGRRGRFELVERSRGDGLDYADLQLALVSDNTLSGNTGPASGHRYRAELNPVVGGLQWVEYLADLRRYDPIIFGTLTVATRLYANWAVGPNETAFPKYVARPDFVRGYDRTNAFYSTGCQIATPAPSNCSAVQLLGSRAMVGNIELRFPVLRPVMLGFAPFAIPQLDGAAFFDVGVAWSADQQLFASRPPEYDAMRQRYPLRSYGASLRMNLFNYATLRWDYAVPLDQPERKGFWTWSLWPSF
ncbi:MAG: PD40 domain-containing protein, partial [Gemmatimonadaceae bacterium]|nr:PD40 domain-containing protein [Gemmatimonadaceae bacterium]